MKKAGSGLKVSARALIEHKEYEKRFLMAKPLVKNLFHFPGGKKRYDESLEQTVKREVFEETRLIINELELILKMDQVNELGEKEEIKAPEKGKQVTRKEYSETIKKKMEEMREMYGGRGGGNGRVRIRG